MQLSSVFVALSVVLAAVSATPTARHVKSMNSHPYGGGAAGAAYFITNDPSGNFIVTADIMSNGKLSLSEAVSTGGIGAHGKVAANGPDGLFSQGSVKASVNGRVLAAVNPGSNTISLFSIDPKNPSKIKMIGEPISSGGEFPMSVAFNKAGTRLCALNGGEVAGVKCFSVDPRKGLSVLSQTARLLSLNQTTPATGPPGSASHIIFNDDGSQLFASIKGTPPTPGYIAVWNVAADGSLSKDFKSVAPPSGGALPFGMNFVPGKNAVLATDPALGFTIIDFADPTKSTAVNVSGQKAVCWSSHSTKTGNFYITDIGTSLVTEVSVDDNLKATVVKQYQQTVGSATIDTDIATVNGKDFLYILAPNATQVQVMALEAPGAAAQLQTLEVSGPAKRASLPLSAFNIQGMTTFVKA